MSTVGTPWMWGAFLALVAGMLALDLGVFHRRAHKVTTREALTWSGIWIGLAIAFAGFVFVRFGPETGEAFVTGYLIEKALSVDNLFVFYALFASFGVRAEHQHHVLFWGIVGAIAFRAALIFGGVALIGAFHWLIYLFGVVLVLTGLKMFRREEEGGPKDVESGFAYRTLRRIVPISSGDHGGKLWVREHGKLLATQLLLVLLLVEASDVLFAIDSILALFAITEDPFILLTSNVFAILGLRSLYFLLADMADRFHYLQPGLAIVLVFVGAKMLLADVFHIPVLASLAVVVVLLGGSIVASLVKNRRDAARAAARPAGAEG